MGAIQNAPECLEHLNRKQTDRVPEDFPSGGNPILFAAKLNRIEGDLGFDEGELL